MSIETANAEHSTAAVAKGRTRNVLIVGVGGQGVIMVSRA